MKADVVRLAYLGIPVAADLDADGDVDLVVANQFSTAPGISILFNTMKP